MTMPIRLPAQPTDASERLQQYPPPEWDDWVEWDARQWSKRAGD